MTPEPTLVLVQGLPRSGKSTWIQKAIAIQQATTIDTEAVVVSPDAIRRALHGHRFIPEAEEHVWATAYTMARALFFSGHRLVYVDATNTTHRRREPWMQMARKLEVACNLIVFRTDADTCKQRADRQGDYAIIPVIERMLNQWEDPKPEDGWEQLQVPEERERLLEQTGRVE